MHDITDGKLQIANLSRVEEVQLWQSHRSCKKRQWDSFAYVLSGKVDYCMDDGRKFTLSAGDVQFLPLHCCYTMDIYPEGVHYIVCDFVSTSPGPRKDVWFHAQNPHIYERLFRELNLRFSTEAPDKMASSLSILFQIYAQIVKDHHPSYLSGEAKKKISAAQTYILRNPADRALSVKQLAGNARMSEVHFRRLFHDMYGISPTKYITDARIAKAKSLMGLAEMRLEDIALQSGFSSTAYFCTVFKAATGVTPAYYRQHFCLHAGDN